MRTLLALTLAAITIPMINADGVFNLTPEDIAAMPPGVAQNYQASVDAFTAQRYLEGYQLLCRAGEEAENDVKLQFILGQISTNIARHLRTENTIAMAQRAYNRILRSPQATDADRERAQGLLTAAGGIPEEIEQQTAEEQRERERAEHIHELREQMAAQAAEQTAGQAAGPANQPRVNSGVDAAEGMPPDARRDMMAIQDSRDTRDNMNMR